RRKLGGPPGGSDGLFAWRHEVTRSAPGAKSDAVTVVASDRNEHRAARSRASKRQLSAPRGASIFFSQKLSWRRAVKRLPLETPRWDSKTKEKPNVIPLRLVPPQWSEVQRNQKVSRIPARLERVRRSRRIDHVGGERWPVRCDRFERGAVW